MLYSYNFVIHGTMEVEAESTEEAYDLIRDGLSAFDRANLPTEALRTWTRRLDINEVEPELIEDRSLSVPTLLLWEQSHG